MAVAGWQRGKNVLIILNFMTARRRLITLERSRENPSAARIIYSRNSYTDSGAIFEYNQNFLYSGDSDPPRTEHSCSINLLTSISCMEPHSTNTRLWSVSLVQCSRKDDCYNLSDNEKLFGDRCSKRRQKYIHLDDGSSPIACSWKCFIMS